MTQRIPNENVHDPVRASAVLVDPGSLTLAARLALSRANSLHTLRPLQSCIRPDSVRKQAADHLKLDGLAQFHLVAPPV